MDDALDRKTNNAVDRNTDNPVNPNQLPWWQKTIVYEIYPRSFQDTTGQGTGTIKGITSRLDYLASLSVGALWLTPVYPSPMADNGYDIIDYYTIDPSFGDLNDMKELIAEAGKRDIKIVMDLVFNHTSDQCPWFLESRTSRTNPKADWYIWRDPKPDGSAPTNWRGIFGGSAWEWCEERGQYYLHTFLKEQPDLNWENPDVRQALYDIANYWVDLGIGGFRIDAICYIKKPAVFEDAQPDGQDGMSRVHDATGSQPGIFEFLREFKENVREGHDIFTVAEADGVSANQLHDWVGSRGVFDMVLEFNHTHVPMGEKEFWCYPAPWKLTDLKQIIGASQRQTSDDGWYAAFFENHDQPRSVDNFLPSGKSSPEAAKALAAVLLTLRGTPFIYQGEELGLTNVAWPSIGDYNDVLSLGQYDYAIAEGFSEAEALAAVQRFSRDNARTPMQWSAEPNAGFTTGTPWFPVHDDFAIKNVDAESRDPRSVLNWYRALGKLRKELPELTAGDYEEMMAESESLFAFKRNLGSSYVATVANFTDQPVLFNTHVVEGAELLLTSVEEPEPDLLQPWEARLYKTK